MVRKRNDIAAAREAPPPIPLRDLQTAARRAARSAHAPYSNFPVGAALLDDRGALFAGGNVENAAYPLGICAERAALLAWRAAAGGPIRWVVIHTETREPTAPCGLCREALLRWAPAAEVFLSSPRGLAGPFSPSHWLPGGRPARGRR